MLLTGRDSALARRKSLRLRDLDGLECIGLVEGRTSRDQLSGALQRQGVSLATVMTVCDWDTAIHLVELGLGSAIVPSWHAHASTTSASVVAIPISGLAPIRVGWALRESYEMLKPARAFMQLLQRDFASRSHPPGVRVLR